MTSSNHDDRIEVLSVAGVAAGSSTGAIGDSSNSRSQGYCAQGLQGLGTTLPGAGHPGGAAAGSGEKSGGAAAGGAVGGAAGGGKGGGGRRTSSAGGASGGGRRSSTRQSSIHSHRPSTHDARRGRGYTYLVPSPDDQFRTVGPIPEKEIKTESQKRVARIVMVLASLMLIMSLLLVGVTLSMSDHIDEMASTTEMSAIETTRTVRKMNGFSTTPKPRPYTQSTAAHRRNDSSTPSPEPLL